MPTPTQELLALYDRMQRQQVRYTDSDREETPEVVRHLSHFDQTGTVLYTRLTPDNLTRIIDREIAYFDRLGRDFEWKLHRHDEPPDLKERLVARGFEAEEEEEAIMLLEIDAAPTLLLEPVSLDVRRLTRPEHVVKIIRVEEAVWQEDFSPLVQRLRTDLTDYPEQLSLYAVYMDNQPVSVAWSNFHPDSPFVSLWGGSTLPAYRRQGCYRALLAVRLQEARERDRRFLTVDASPMSRPILEKLGFQCLTMAYPCWWRRPQPAEA